MVMVKDCRLRCISERLCMSKTAGSEPTASLLLIGYKQCEKGIEQSVVEVCIPQQTCVPSDKYYEIKATATTRLVSAPP